MLKAAVERNFDILLTIDKNIDYQQNVGRFAIAIVILDTSHSHIRYIEPLIPTFKAQIDSYMPGNSYKVEAKK